MSVLAKLALYGLQALRLLHQSEPSPFKATAVVPDFYVQTAGIYRCKGIAEGEDEPIQIQRWQIPVGAITHHKKGSPWI